MPSGASHSIRYGRSARWEIAARDLGRREQERAVAIGRERIRGEPLPAVVDGAPDPGVERDVVGREGQAQGQDRDIVRCEREIRCVGIALVGVECRPALDGIRSPGLRVVDERPDAPGVVHAQDGGRLVPAQGRLGQTDDALSRAGQPRILGDGRRGGLDWRPQRERPMASPSRPVRSFPMA